MIYKVMKKKRLVRFSNLLKRCGESSVTMKCCVVLFFLFSLNVSADVYAQQNLVTLDLSDVSVEHFIETVKKQSVLRFMYNSEVIQKAGNVSVKVENKPLKQVLDLVLWKVNLEYEFFNDVVLIREKEEKKEDVRQKTVRGCVKDQSGTPLPGVTVVLKGENLGVATDIDGNYSLSFFREKRFSHCVFVCWNASGGN